MALASPSAAKDWFIDESADLQSVINQTSDGDVIYCSAGTYAGSIRFQGKDIQVIAVDGPDTTFIDPQGSVIPTLTLDAGAPATATLQGFTVLSGTSTIAGCVWISFSSIVLRECRLEQSTLGPALLCEYSNFKLFDCEFLGNGDITRDGGAINADNCIITAQGCTFMGNQARRGGGIRSYNSSLFINDCLFEGNQAFYGSQSDSYGGGAIFCEGSSEGLSATHLNGSTFRANYSDSRGGALHILTSLWTCIDSIFEDNTCNGRGGAVQAQSMGGSSTVERTIFRRNEALVSNGGYGGAIRTLNAAPQFEDCVFRQNYARYGGAFYTESSNKPALMNCIMTENVGDRTYYGTASWNYLTNVTIVNNDNPYNDEIVRYCQIKNSIIWGPQSGFANSGVTWSDVRGITGGTGNIDEYPMFVNRWSGDYSLLPGSPCIDAGDPASGSDSDGTVRDMGATGYVLLMENGDCNGNGISDGIDSLGNDCNHNGIPDECDVASGLLDCNGNGINDCDDLASGSSPDCNSNGVPDECDIASGTSLDENENGIPDECEDVGASFCDSNPNSVGNVATLSILGSPFISDNDVTLASELLPPSVLGYYLVAPAKANVPNFGGSMGVLCLGGQIVRLDKPPYGSVLSSGMEGEMSLTLDLEVMPNKAKFQPGETWYFQLWYRDKVDGSNTSNTSSGAEVMFL